MEDPITTSLQKALPPWTKFDLDSRRPNLDSQASTVKDHTKASQAARKVLAESTKQFKKSIKQAEQKLTSLHVVEDTGNDETTASNDNQQPPRQQQAKVNEVMDSISKSSRQIVKSYQDEIDQLTRRNKYSSSTFLDLYKSIYELPDPVPLFTASSEHLDAKVRQIEHLLRGMEEIQNEMEGREKVHALEDDRRDEELEGLKLKLKEEEERCLELRELYNEAKEEQTSSDRQRQGGSSMLSKEEKEELIALRSEVAEYEVEFKNLKNQDITIKKLNKRIEDLVDNQEEELERELKKAQEHLAETEGRRASEALEREAALERKYASIELELKAERAGREATQAHLLQADEGLNEREAAWEAQRQILMDDSARLRENLHVVQRERDELNLRVSAMMDDGEEGSEGMGGSGSGNSMSGDNSGGGAMAITGGVSQAEIALERKAYEAEVNELTVTVTSMREEIKVKEERTFELQRSMQTTIESLENERSSLVNKVAGLEAELADAPTREMVDNIRRELRILKKLEYNAVDADTEKDEPEITSTPSGTGGEKDDLETVLIGKLRKAEAELVKERREKSDHLSECEQLRQQLKDVEKAKSEADSLAARLEADLEKAITVPDVSRDEVKKTDISFSASNDPSTLQRIIDPTAPAPPVPPPTSSSESDTGNSAAEKRNDDHSVATIVMAQRDRLRARCDALEAERDSFKRELQVQVSTAESLKVDNTKLYEKVRYLQNYNNKSAPSASGLNSHRDLDLEALEQRYEQSVDPFRQFSRNEKQRKMKEMSPMERTVFVVAKTVLANKEMRTALFFYVLGMHLLVFVTTYHWSHGCSSYPTAANHPDHLAHFHGGAPHDETSSSN